MTAIATQSLPRTRIYVEPEHLSADRAVLTGSGYHHLRHVMRFKPGDELIVFDGAGKECFGVLELFQGDTAVVRVLGDITTSTESSLHLTIAPCLARGKKIDLIVEKAVELGADRICVVTSERSVGRLSDEQAIDRVERWRRIAKSAAEQCGRTLMPVVERIRTLEEYVATRPEGTLGLLFTVGADPDPPATLRQRYPDTDKVIAIIGPEGGFTREEIEFARGHGFIDVGLGPRTLRTETAAIVAAAVCQHLWGDLGRKPPPRDDETPTEPPSAIEAKAAAYTD
jgi:16S rRNA (uracil1498-N3)-methyltransferase